MKTAMTLAMAALTFTMVACAAETPTEQTGKSEDHYDVSCVSSIQDPPGSAAWHAKLEACLASQGAGAGGGGDYGAGSGGQSCTQSVSCFNGSCTCGSGPNKGQSCDGSQPSGAGSCSDLCRFCQ